MLGLSASTFCVLLVYRHSPIAYSIVDFIPWYHKDAKHCGVETVLRYVTQIVHIIKGRDLIKLVRKRCERRRYIAKKTLEVEMGPVSDHNLNIAPPLLLHSGRSMWTIHRVFKFSQAHNNQSLACCVLLHHHIRYKNKSDGRLQHTFLHFILCTICKRRGVSKVPPTR